MLRSVFSQIGARMDVAAATRPSIAVAQAILVKTRKGLVEQGEKGALFHAEGFSTLLAWVGSGLKRAPEETATLHDATWQELAWVRMRLKNDQAALRLLDGSPSATAREVASQLAFASAIVNNLVWLRMTAMKGPAECREMAARLADDYGQFWLHMTCAAAGTCSSYDLIMLLKQDTKQRAAPALGE
jgi:hypothetical protein